MATLKAWIEEAAKGEKIVGVVIGDFDGWYSSEVFIAAGDCPKNVVLSWEAAQPFLLYEFSDDFGEFGCHPTIAWTTSKVIFVVQYDGATAISSVPRHPVNFIRTSLEGEGDNARAETNLRRWARLDLASGVGVSGL